MIFSTPLSEMFNVSAISFIVIRLLLRIKSFTFYALLSLPVSSLSAFCPETEPRRNVNSTRSVLGPKCSLSGIIMTALFFYISALLLLDSPGLSFLKNPCQSAVEYGAGDYVIGYISPTCPLSLLMYAEPNKSLRCLTVSWLVGAF